MAEDAPSEEAPTEEAAEPTEIPPDYLGIASVILATLAAVCCAGICVPYLNGILIFASMGLSLVGTLLGVLALVDRRRKETTFELALLGTIGNGIVLLFWIVYWLFVFGALFLMVGTAVVLVVSELL